MGVALFCNVCHCSAAEGQLMRKVLCSCTGRFANGRQSRVACRMQMSHCFWPLAFGYNVGCFMEPCWALLEPSRLARR
eukprot:4900728-Pyramimonas_sp.AAC.1